MNSNIFDIVTKNGVIFLKFKELNNIDFINHAVSTRHGGVSDEGDFKTLNLGFSTSDSRENVTENYVRFCASAGFSEKRLVFSAQTHSSNYRYTDENDIGKGIFRDKDYTDTDALITDKEEIGLVIHTADCVPIAYIDTENKVIANAHCGWRGTYSLLQEKVLTAMKEKYNTKPENVICTIGPAICSSCYEVSADLYNDFLNKFGYTKEIFIKDGKFYLDLMGINKKILIKNGVGKVIVSDLCTCCNKNDLYSHRGLGKGRGLLSSIIKIKGKE